MSSNFWADRLGQGHRPPPPPPPAASPPAATPWWATPTTVPDASQAAYGPPVPPSPPAAYVPVRPPPHQRQARGRCPECGSDDFFEVDPRQGPRCYGCGYCGGNRTRNSTQGVVSTTGQAPSNAKAARQIAGAGYRPDIIVGHV